MRRRATLSTVKLLGTTAFASCPTKYRRNSPMAKCLMLRWRNMLQGSDLGCKRPRQGLEQPSFRSAPVRRFGEDHRKPPPEQRVAQRVSGEVNGDGDEPQCLSCSRSGTRDRGVLLEQGQEEG